MFISLKNAVITFPQSSSRVIPELLGMEQENNVYLGKILAETLQGVLQPTVDLKGYCRINIQKWVYNGNPDRLKAKQYTGAMIKSSDPSKKRFGSK